MFNITKKKRSPDNSAHGAYYCTKRWNETTQKFDLVHFSTSNLVGDKDDISTWETVGGYDEYCKFAPPLNASNFAVTLIGGGASEVPDYDSLGGRGAAGAVIVEW